MVLKCIKKSIVILLAATVLFIISGCNSSDDSSPKIIPGTFLASEKSHYQNYANAAAIGTLAQMLSGGLLMQIQQNDPTFTTASPVWVEWLSQMTSFTNLVRYGVSTHTVTYTSTDSAGSPVVLSGVAMFPVKPDNNDAAMPVFAMSHPTIVARDESPSLVLSGMNPSIIMSALIASTGYVVIIPDYLGFGSNYDVHPYGEKSSAYAVVDMVNAIGKMPPAADRTRADISRTVLSGYSEGGYVSMLAAKVMHKRGMSVTAVAPLSGPYSISGAMREMMLTADAAFPAPYFLPNTLRAYSSVYGHKEPLFAFSNSIIPQVLPDYPEFNKLLYDSFDGSKSELFANDLMRKVPSYAGPHSILTAPFKLQLSDVNSSIVRILAENNGYYNWAPAMPMKLFHHTADDLVPARNTTEAVAAFKNAGVTVESEFFNEQLPISPLVHLNAFPHAMLKGFFWLDSKVYPTGH